MLQSSVYTYLIKQKNKKVENEKHLNKRNVKVEKKVLDTEEENEHNQLKASIMNANVLGNIDENNNNKSQNDMIKGNLFKEMQKGIRKSM